MDDSSWKRRRSDWGAGAGRAVGGDRLERAMEGAVSCVYFIFKH